MTKSNTVIDEAAAAIGLAVDTAWRADVAANMAVLLRFGREVETFSLPDEIEPAPVFVPLA